MSRYDLEPKDPSQVSRVVVGWDQPLMTFFVQAFRSVSQAADEDDQFVHWVGCSYREILDVDRALSIAARYAVIPPDLGRRLYGDQDEGR